MNRKKHLTTPRTIEISLQQRPKRDEFIKMKILYNSRKEHSFYTNFSSFKVFNELRILILLINLSLDKTYQASIAITL